MPNEVLGTWYAHAILWITATSRGGRLGTDLEVIGADSQEDAIAEAHKLIDRYHRFVGPDSYVEVGVGFGDRDLKRCTPETSSSVPRMPLHRELRVTAQAVDDGERLGMTGNVSTQIREMCFRSAPLTQPDPRFRRRFYEYTFWIEDDQVLGVARVEEQTPRRPKRRAPSN